MRFKIIFILGESFTVCDNHIVVVWYSLKIRMRHTESQISPIFSQFIGYNLETISAISIKNYNIYTKYPLFQSYFRENQSTFTILVGVHYKKNPLK